MSEDAPVAPVSHPIPAALAERIGQFCRQYGRNDQLADLMTEVGADDLLASALSLATSDSAGPAEVTRALDAVEEVLAGLGIHGLTSPNREWRPLPGVTASDAALSVWVCPVRRCARAETSAAACGLTGGPLTAIPIPR
ncbi:hypothetical protein ACTMTJ_34905 [Phytohabitans sp. LJ34]|uniref:hypothetical protein n=1 Tax=Phytohabitans sp. LJ34 TaxID=3452217 RepID=UPI003F897B97